MKNFTKLLTTAALIAGVAMVAPAFADAAKQTIVLTQVDPVVLATGWRATAIIGAAVYDDAGTEIGKLEDMIITASGTVPYAVVSVGGFLGMDAHHVVVAASALELVGKKLTLHGATKESLKALPNYTFAS
ncbi:PRC-barrel domain-containing protein [Cypionkella sinensis]|uniref:PRC-barrel domain-containing protein n=1 Tax=Cypionkella sinensis TaxID=1756043 RepID=A0ABV7J056_9RHOB